MSSFREAFGLLAEKRCEDILVELEKSDTYLKINGLRKDFEVALGENSSLITKFEEYVDEMNFVHATFQEEIYRKAFIDGIHVKELLSKE